MADTPYLISPRLVHTVSALTTRAGFLLFLRGVEKTLGRKLTASEHDTVVCAFLTDATHDEAAYHLNRRETAVAVRP
jgi:hypothetical protein